MAQNNLRQSLVYLLLSGIFLIAFLVRVINLANFPVGFHNDEVSIGYSAYSLLQTGKDRSGEMLPLSIDQFGDFRPAGYFYLAAVSEKVFGVNEFAVRFPAALFGSLLIFAGYQLALVLFKNKPIALLFALNVALNPWLIIVSRSSSESIVSLFLGTLGIIFWLNGLENKKIKQIVLACIMFTGSFLFYHSARLFVPLFLVSLLALTFFQTTIKNKK
ncbi:glycosyltransferase family 39 protein, partial [Candidatus Microgenomates bacterium]|nr:glycosyltransferase family 39 protein [Candidatus Microgenomates bacterium]